MSNRYFPISTKTACQLKWAWSTIFLYDGTTKSCHRTAESKLTTEDFMNFHNTEVKIQDRISMLNGQWPATNCAYCKEIESAVDGGVSDRIVMNSIPGLSPPDLLVDPTSVIVSPTIVEVYFRNTCNLGCLYCNGMFSSTINNENLKFGDFSINGVEITATRSNFNDFVPVFWKWFENNFQTLSRFHVAGGEPLLQKEFDVLLDMVEKYPNPQCEFNIITNLMIPYEKLEAYISRFKKILAHRKLKRIDITCSLDCLGPESEYVRYGLNIDLWMKNFNFLLSQTWLYLNVNQVITALTIKTMPELVEMIATWKKTRPLGHRFGLLADKTNSYLAAENLGGGMFADDARKILSSMSTGTDEDQREFRYMQSIMQKIVNSELNLGEAKKLFIYLNEIDRRRGTDWRTVFPWLIPEFEKCGIVK
jgi:hypothetical protein